MLKMTKIKTLKIGPAGLFVVVRAAALEGLFASCSTEVG